ncbi:MBL fold metallo-hydrolase [Saccharibacillus sp. CPCC 101409]|uniref:MBL fold metallo-hydrolase n=1 Tax=Saccharibacillus sp. CPCC 101409 TaxID=3058041 RepID=UPI0026733407|nr:MBL fold metallo-hydrolase [Saccharibacillus sp. CPCC 101409]MDO3409272.1 MBL fold metallo-hydrolase [Saccharibacillus sp. CPCC 101409]
MPRAAEPVTERIYRLRLPLPFRLNHVNAYLIRDDSGWSAVDPGLLIDTTRPLWESALAGLGLTFADIRRIFVTHFHPDHYGFAGELQRLSGAPVYASNVTFRLAERHFSRGQIGRSLNFYLRAGMPAELARAAASFDERLLEQTADVTGERIDIGGAESGAPMRSLPLGGRTYTVVTGSGHAEGSVGLLDEEEGLLIGGDLLLQKITPNVSFSYDEERNPLREYFDTLEQLKRRKIDTVLPGHGSAFKLDSRLIESVRSHHEERLAEAEEAVTVLAKAGAGTAAPYGICGRLFPKVSDAESLRFAVGETSAHLRELEARGVIVRRTEADGRLLFAPAGPARA